MDYLSWLQKTPKVNEMVGIEEYIQKEKEESFRVMKKRLKKGKQTEKQKSEDILGEANKLYVQGKLEESVGRIKEALSFCSMSDSAYYLLGMIYEELKEPEKSFNAFLIAASIKRTDAVLWERLYATKKEEGDVEYQLYILKRLKKIKPGAALLEEMLGIYKCLNNQEKIFEVRAEMIGHTGFQVELIEELIVTISKLKNKAKILQILNREINRDKNLQTLSDEFLIGYIDVLFIEKQYHALGGLNDSLQFLGRRADSTRSDIILGFSGLLLEIAKKCTVCQSTQPFCCCKNNIIIDDFGHMLLQNEKDSVIINSCPDIALVSDPLHLVLTSLYIDLLMKMKKTTLSLNLLIKIDKHLAQTFPLSPIRSQDQDLDAQDTENQNTVKIHAVIIKECLGIKKKIGLLYEKLKDYDKSIIAFKDILRLSFLTEINPSLFEEIKMKISQIYEKSGNIDLALEYALQIQVPKEEKCDQIIRGTLHFYKASECTKNRSLLYKAEHIFNSKMIATTDSERKNFLNTTQELILALLKNKFIFTKKKKKRRDGTNHPAGSHLFSTKDLENDFELLAEIEGLGADVAQAANQPPPEAAPELTETTLPQAAHPEATPSQTLPRTASLYYDALASLLGGLGLDEWFGLLKKYVVSLHRDNHHSALLLLKKILSSSILKTHLDGYSSLLWLLIKISIESKDLSSLNFGITQMTVFYANRMASSHTLYYLGYYLVSKIPMFFTNREFFMFQKNLQRTLKRKMQNKSVKKDHILILLSFSYMPSFIYTETARNLEEMIEASNLPKTDTSLLGIVRAVSISSLFLIHASSRKVLDRNNYIRKSISILTSHIESLQKDVPVRVPPVPVPGEDITYHIESPATEHHLYTEDSPSEKLSVLLYNLGRAYHQYKLYGLAERCYIEAMTYSCNIDIHQFAQINLSVLKKKIRTEPRPTRP
ncbi:hypothetical protein NEDG_01273 [Nematocida displodere]|uniref:Uncharacterized protein n=1 Tax=Nematocida displodere TaxID=1805483 RepID=A0A177ECT3_9MICR|nr:hypothetical protein NEDG_01273 [Nematocida displodere]